MASGQLSTSVKDLESYQSENYMLKQLVMILWRKLNFSAQMSLKKAMRDLITKDIANELAEGN